MNSSRSILTLALGILTLGAATTASAGTVYTLNGPNFTDFFNSPPETTANHMSVSLTFDTPLAANLSLSSAAALSSWTMSDQVTTFDQSNATFDTFTLSTNASGAITSWNLTAFNNGRAGSDYTELISSFSSAVFDYARYNTTSGFSWAENCCSSGTAGWNAASTDAPEPSTLLMFSGSLGVLLFGMWRQRRPVLSASEGR